LWLDSTMNKVDMVIEAVGGQNKLAERMNVSRQVVYAWTKTGIIPVRRVLKVSEVTGIPVHVLRPDIYPAP
jgi:DNA-binding transcriptional regulator YdaS (Cro superfamily)